MNTTVKASLVLVILVTLLSVTVYVTGLHKSFTLGQSVFLGGAIAFNIGVVYWALRRDASTRGYGAQLLTALGIGLLAGFLITVVSWFLLSTVFPDALEETREAAIAYMDAQGTPADEVERQLRQIDAATPMSQSLPGGVGTLFTSLVSGAIFAIFLRRK